MLMTTTLSLAARRKPAEAAALPRRAALMVVVSVRLLVWTRGAWLAAGGIAVAATACAAAACQRRRSGCGGGAGGHGRPALVSGRRDRYRTASGCPAPSSTSRPWKTWDWSSPQSCRGSNERSLRYSRGARLAGVAGRESDERKRWREQMR